jgi:mono/diheme cytochrome c family protein
VRRGYRPPPSLHIERLRTAPPGHFYDVMSHGFGAMPDYAGQISVRDRWAIVAYIRALQLSQNAEITDVPEAARSALSETRK